MQSPEVTPARYCCFIPCDKDAQWEIVSSLTPNEPTDACTDHVGALLTDAPEHYIYPILSN